MVALVWLVFGQTVRFGFLNYDDNLYVYQNPTVYRGLSTAGWISAFTQPLVGNWHPLTSLSLMADGTVFHLNPGGYHFVNVLLHSGSVVLLFWVLTTMTGSTWRSAFVAAVFAIHPLRAESVVWISERKDVLSGCWFMLTLAAYIRYTRNSTFVRYLVVLAACIFGLLAKPMLVTLPFLLLLLDFWPLRRWRNKPAAEDASQVRSVSGWQIIVEKVPLVLAAGAISIATIIAQRGALEAAAHWSLGLRISNALLSVWIYLRQMVWPFGLAIFYPHPEAIPLWQALAALLLLLGVSTLVLLWRRERPYLLTGWFWYLGMLVPVLGIVQVGWQAHADRYTYLPQIGIYIAATWVAADLARRWKATKGALAVGTIVTLAAFTVAGWIQTSYWSSPIRLWTHTLAVTKNNDVAERGLGTALVENNQLDEAIRHELEALRLRPDERNIRGNLAVAFMKKKDFAEAIRYYRAALPFRPNDASAHRDLGKALLENHSLVEATEQFREALRIRPNDSDAAYSLANAFLEQGDLEQAIQSYERALQMDPENTAARYNLGTTLYRAGRAEEAIKAFRQCLRLQRDNFGARNNLALALFRSGRIGEAIAEWQELAKSQPNNADVRSNLAAAFLREGRYGDAVAEWEEALRLDPGRLGTKISLAWVLATAPEASARNASQAAALAEKAVQGSGGKNPQVFRVLAAAFAENGEFEKAIEAAEEGAALAHAESRSELASQLQGDIALYRQRIPLRETSP